MTHRMQTRRGEQRNNVVHVARNYPPETACTRAYLIFQRLQAAISLFAHHCWARTAHCLGEGHGTVVHGSLTTAHKPLLAVGYL